MSGLALDNSLGAVFISAIVGASLWGIGTAQVWHYFLSQHNDHPLIKAMVLVAWLLDTGAQVIVTHEVYGYTITHFGDVSFLSELPRHKTSGISVLVIALTTVIVQCFFIWRIWRLAPRKWLFVTPLAVLLVAESVLFSFEASYVFQSQTWGDMMIRLGKVPIICLSLASAADALIAAMMCSLLVRSRTEFSRTKSLISRLVVLVLGTNVITSLFAFGGLICLIAWPKTLLYQPFFQNLIRVELNSFLAALNMRPYISGSAKRMAPTSSPFETVAHNLQPRGKQAQQPPKWLIRMDALSTSGTVDAANENNIATDVTQSKHDTSVSVPLADQV